MLLGSSNEGIVVRHSPIFSVALSASVAPIFTVVPSSCAPFTNLQCCTFHKCCADLHCCAFQVHHSPISSVVPSTSVAPIVTVAPSTVAPFWSVAPFVSYHFVPCDYATRQFYIINNLATDVNMPCRLFNCIIKIEVLATTEHVGTC